MQSIKTIAVGFDGSTGSTSAVRWALDAAHQYGANVVVVHAVGLLARLDTHSTIAQLQSSLQQLVSESELDSQRARMEIADGDACSVMLRMALAPTNADLLVVGTRGQSAHAGLLGSTSLELAEHTTVPLVVVPTT